MRNKINSALTEIKLKSDVSNAILEDALLATYRLLDSKSEHDYNLCLSSICHIADIAPKDKMVQQLLHDCIIKSRVFLYSNLLSANSESFSPQHSFQDTILQNHYTSKKTNTTLTRPQKEVFDAFQRERRLIVSAPTSFGKTRIIREIISANSYKRIALIMPTVSLLSEQYQDIKNNIKNYIISKSSKIKIDSNEKYILVLTPERMSAFLDENPDFKVDFFVMDEIYKIDFKLNDDRYKVFSDILYRLSRRDTHFYLIGPYISEFSSRFQERFRAKFVRFDLEIVQKNYYALDNSKNLGLQQIENSPIRIVKERYKNFSRIISHAEIDGKFLIYRYRKQYVEDTAKKLSDSRTPKNYNQELTDYLASSISPDWDLIECLKKGVGFHHGGMPRHIQDLIVDEFNSPSNEGIDYLFCTTSLTEGINSAAKNVVIYDKKMGTGDPLATLDRKNIEGRAGRFMQHFIGRIFYLETDDAEDKPSVVEIEYLDKSTPDIETLLQLDRTDIPPEKQHLHESFISKLDLLHIPESLIRSNRFVSVDGQLALIQHLRQSSTIYIVEDQYIKLECQSEILSTIFDFLFSDKDKGKSFNNEYGKSILIQLTNYYAYHKPSFKVMLNSSTVKKTTNHRERTDSLRI